MPASRRSSVLAPAAVAVLAFAFAFAFAFPLIAHAAPNALPPLPGTNAPAASSPPPATGTGTGADAKAPAKGGSTDYEQLRRGVVQVEQGGRPMAVGMVLSKDGRVLTSLSALGSAGEPEIRYADNTVVKAKVGHKDKAIDLALLIPQSGKWLDGLMPTDADPMGVELKAFLPRAGKLSGVGVGVKGRTDARAKEGEPLKAVYDLDLKGVPGIPGAPLLDPNGRVVGMIVKACKAESSPKTSENADKPSDKPPPCAPITVGLPVPALRGFLMKTPANAVQPGPWLGLGGAPTEAGNVRGVRVMGVTPGSPAEKAGLKPGGESPDTIVAVDGQPVETPEQLADVIARRAIGQTVKLLVFAQGKFREVSVALRAAP
jgi:serine protease Do